MTLCYGKSFVRASIHLCTCCLYLIIPFIPDAGKALIYYQTMNFKLLKDYADNKISKTKSQ